MIKINEIFFSIQGESTYAGAPTVFVRTTGCNLRCTYCDSTYSYYEGSPMSLNSIIDEIKKYSTKFVCITGGEPLLQKEVYELMSSLCDEGYKVSLETSGSKNVSLVDPRVKIILDIKTPDSGAANSFLLENLKLITPTSELKFVICSKKDFIWAENFCHEHRLFHNFTILYSPSFSKVDPQWLAEEILQHKSSARLQLQLHKYIWSPDTRGV